MRALTIEADRVRFVLEVDPAQGAALEPVRVAAEAAVAALPAIVIAITGRSAREWVFVMQLTLLTALLYGLGLSAAIVLPPGLF